MLQCNRFHAASATSPACPTTGNRVNFSALRHCEMEHYEVATCSIKYILEGTEHYFLKGRRFSVSGGRFLLVNARHPVDILIRSRKDVVSFCLHLEEGLLQEVYAQLQWAEGRLLDAPFEKPPLPPLEELLYSDSENSLGAYLRQMAGRFHRTAETIAMEPAAFYYNLAQQLLQVQNRFPDTAGGLGVIKNSTKQELFRRLEVARELLDESGADPFSMDAVAQQCALSGSHLFRSFRKVYGVSPYRYLLQRRIEKAAGLLARRDMAVTDVAFHCGFADGASFSKAFRKAKGQSPASFLAALR